MLHISVIGYGLMNGGMLALYFSKALLASTPLGLALQAIAGLLMAWARITLGTRSFHVPANPTAGKLIVHGPYRYMRHPIYAALLYFNWAGASTNVKTTSVAAALMVTIGVAIRISLEERMLHSHFQGYANYAALTPRLVPIYIPLFSVVL
jgi:protein-S-isoprenylcysteine O-methyltransferase Ste14